MKTARIHINASELAEDRSNLKTVLVETFDRFGLFDNSETSRVPETIISIVEREHYGFGIGGKFT